MGGCSWGVKMGRSQRGERAGGHLFDDDLAVLVDRAVVDHADDGHTQVTPDSERDAEADAAQHGDDVAARQPEAGAVAQRSLALLLRRGSAILRQLDHLTCLLLLLQPPARQAQPHACGLFRFRFRRGENVLTLMCGIEEDLHLFFKEAYFEL